MIPFLIFALPRSRTAWLSEWLTTDRSACLHEPLAECEALGDLQVMLVETRKASVGIADTGAVLFARPLLQRWPRARVLFVHRDTRDVAASMDRIGLGSQAVPFMAEAMMEAVNLPEAAHAMHVRFEDLGNIHILASIWRHLLGPTFDADRTRALMAKNVQVDVRDMLTRADPARLLRLIDNTGGRYARG